MKVESARLFKYMKNPEDISIVIVSIDIDGHKLSVTVAEKKGRRQQDVMEWNEIKGKVQDYQ